MTVFNYNECDYYRWRHHSACCTLSPEHLKSRSSFRTMSALRGQDLCTQPNLLSMNRQRTQAVSLNYVTVDKRVGCSPVSPQPDINRFPWPISFGQIAPWGTGTQHPKHAIDDFTMLSPGASGPLCSGFRGGNKGLMMIHASSGRSQRAIFQCVVETDGYYNSDD